jgi:hypothetical protein
MLENTNVLYGNNAQTSKCEQDITFSNSGLIKSVIENCGKQWLQITYLIKHPNKSMSRIIIRTVTVAISPNILSVLPHITAGEMLSGCDNICIAGGLLAGVVRSWSHALCVAARSWSTGDTVPEANDVTSHERAVETLRGLRADGGGRAYRPRPPR